MRILLKKRGWMLSFFLIGLLYAAFIGEYGPALYADSSSYIDMQSTLPPLYPVFLYMLRRLVGDELYLMIAFWIQSIIWASSVTMVIEYIIKKFSMPRWTSFLFFAAMVLPLSRNNSIPWYFGTHSILTEGVSFAFFNFYFIFLLEGLFEKRTKAHYWIWIWSAILILTRAQFLLCLGLNILVWIYRVLHFHLKKITIVVAFLFMIASYFVCGAIGNIYTYSISGSSTNIWNTSSSLAHILYSTDVEDVVLIEGMENKEFFQKLYAAMDNLKYNYKYAEGNFYERGEHYSEGFNPAYDSLWNIYEAELQAGKNIEILNNQINDIIKALSPNVLRWFRISLLQLPKSLGNSNFFVHPPYDLLFIAMAGILYLGAIGLIGITIYKQGMSKAVLFMLTILIFVMINSVMTTFAIRSVARYLSYTMGFFYIAGFVLIWKLLEGGLYVSLRNKAMFISKDKV